MLLVKTTGLSKKNVLLMTIHAHPYLGAKSAEHDGLMSLMFHPSGPRNIFFQIRMCRIYKESGIQSLVEYLLSILSYREITGR